MNIEIPEFNQININNNRQWRVGTESHGAVLPQIDDREGGGEAVIGAHTVIGGNAWVTASVPPHSTVFHTPEIKIKTVTNA